jgi:hypothetical protein
MRAATSVPASTRSLSARSIHLFAIRFRTGKKAGPTHSLFGGGRKGLVNTDFGLCRPSAALFPGNRRRVQLRVLEALNLAPFSTPDAVSPPFAMWHLCFRRDAPACSGSKEKQGREPLGALAGLNLSFQNIQKTPVRRVNHH